MATSSRQLCRSIQQLSKSIPVKRNVLQISLSRSQYQHARLFSSATSRWADDPAVSGRAPAHFARATPQPSPESSSEPSFDPDELHESEYLTPEKPYIPSDLSASERADYEVLSKPDQVQYLKLQNHLKAIFESGEGQSDLDALVEQTDREIEREDGLEGAIDFPRLRVKANELGYWGEDEDDEFGAQEDGDDDVSDEYITSVAESELDLHRDVREYTRIAAWDLPLLSKYATPFVPPTHATPLRFRYTTHMGESHPSSRKVVVEFSTRDLLSHPSPTYKLSDPQRTKLIKLLGPRYNPNTDVAKISSEKFDTPAQNKRYLGDVIGSLIRESKDKRDTLSDIPVDFRHAKKVKSVVFPEEWKMGKTRVAQLGGVRREQEARLVAPAYEEEVVDGEKVVQSYVRIGELRQTQQAQQLLRR